MSIGITSARITKYQNRTGIGIVVYSLIIPPLLNRLARKFTGILTCSNVYIRFIFDHVIKSMWYNDSIRQVWKIVIKNILIFKRIQASIAIQVPYKLFFLLYPYL